MSEEPKPGRGRPGVSRETWLKTALEVFEKEGVGAVRVETLAKRIGVNKSGFYWHFENRDDLIRALLNFWEELENQPVTALADGEPLNAAEVLAMLADIVDRENLSRMDGAIRQWAKTDTDVSKAYQAKLQRRLHIVRSLFSELGFAGDDLEMRVRTYVCYVSCERDMFADLSAEERATQRSLRLHLLTAKSPD